MKKSLLALALAFAATGAQAAVLLTDNTTYAGLGLNLTAYATGNYNFTFGPKPIPGGITFTASPGGTGGYPYGGNSGQGSVLGQGSYGLAGNGSFGGDAVYAGVDSGTGYAQFAFDTPQTEFGAYFNYAPGVGDAPVISVLSMGNVIASFDLSALAPISTPGGYNQFAFRGIRLSAGEGSFDTFRFGGSYILAAATADGKPQDPTGELPEPMTLGLMGLGLGGLYLTRRRRG